MNTEQDPKTMSKSSRVQSAEAKSTAIYHLKCHVHKHGPEDDLKFLESPVCSFAVANSLPQET